MITIEIQVRGSRETATIRVNAERDSEGSVWMKRSEVEKLAFGLLYHGMDNDSSDTGFSYTNFIRKGSGQEVDVCYEDRAGEVHRLSTPRMVCDDIAKPFSAFGGDIMAFAYNDGKEVA